MKMMKLRNIFVCGWCIALVVACGQSYETKQRMTRAERAKLKTADSLALKVGVMPTLDCMPLFVAKERRLFDTLGVDVRLRMRKAQMDIDTALIGGSVEGAVSDSVRVARMRSRGTALTEVGTTNTSWQLVGNRSARLKEVKQLGDKMVAMTRYSATDFLTDHVLTGVKTTATVYRVQINDVPLRLQMLLNNEMDALWLPEPQATTAREHGHTVLWDTEKHNLWLGRVVFRDKALGDARVKKQIDVFKQAYNMACDSLNQRGVSAYADLLVKYCQTDQKTLDALPKVKFRKL
jgi:NitT/TauT family transport system substrate-binding protein